MKVICIDSSRKPLTISLNEWIEEGVIYTVVSAIKMGLQPGKMGLKLKEIELTDKSFPYEYYDSVRFIPIEGLFMSAEEEEEKEINMEEVNLELI
jgi:hypothetical protein